MVKVVAALIEKENKVLLAKRSTGDPNVFGKWEFPGGKVEPEENEMQAIEREIKEEFELIIKAKEDFYEENELECDIKSDYCRSHCHCRCNRSTGNDARIRTV